MKACYIRRQLVSESAGNTVQNTRKYRTEAKADEQQPEKGRSSYRQGQQDHPRKGDDNPRSYQCIVGGFHRDKSRDQPAEHYPSVVDGDPLRGAVRRKRKRVDKIACAPRSDKKLHAAIKTERKRACQYSLYGKNIRFFVLFVFIARGCSAAFRIFPMRKRNRRYQRDTKLYRGYNTVSRAPRACFPWQKSWHYYRTYGNADTPEAMQPVHMACLVVQGHIVVQPRIYRARSVAHNNGKKHHYPQVWRKTRAEKSHCCQQHGDKRHTSRAEFSDKPAREKAHSPGGYGDDDAVNWGKALGNAEFPMNNRPHHAEQRVGQTERDENYVYNDEQKHSFPPEITFLPFSLLLCPGKKYHNSDIFLINADLIVAVKNI